MMYFLDDEKIIRHFGCEMTPKKFTFICTLIIAILSIVAGLIFSLQLASILGCFLLIFTLFFKVKKNEEVKVIALSAMFFYFVYSTYLGRNNWLGSSFYNLFTSTSLPLGWILLFITLGYFLAIWYMVKKYISKKKLLGIALFTFLFDLAVWYPLSFISYYSGVEGKIMDVSKLLVDTTEKILLSNAPIEKKESKLKDTYANVSIQAKLYKNDKLLFTTNSARFIIENPKQKNVVFEHEKNFKVGNDNYLYSASKVYRPDFVTGVLRAVSWSVFPDRFGDDQKLEAAGITALSNDVYRGRRKAGRSMNWWLIFSATFGLFCSSLCYWKKREIKMAEKHEQEEKELANKLQQAEKTLYQQYKNTGLYQELLFSQLSKEFNDIMASQAKSHLQAYVASLGKGEKQQVYTEQGFEETMDNIKTSIGDRVHSLKNEWAKSISSDTENNQAEEIVQIILDDLRKLKTVFDVNYSNQKLIVIQNIVESAVPKNYSKIRNLEFTTYYLQSSQLDNNLEIIVNLDRLKSIVVNLLQNSSNATQRFKMSLFGEEKKKYIRKFSLSTNIEAYQGKPYYIICVQDNGGGFPNPDIIYKEPVVSSDKSRGERMGSGTVYIDMFVKRMHGFIIASNEIYNDGYLGAKTKIFIPIIKNEEDV